MIYFDNAATTFPKPKNVLKEVRRCIEKYCGNPGRSSHSLSVKTSEKIFETRECIAKFLNAENAENIVFTQNATYALNLAIKTQIPENSHILISNFEHNSVFRPVYSLSKKGKVSYSIFDFANFEKDIPNLINKDTSCIISILSSNVNGKTIDFKKLSSLAQKHGLKLIIDASQYVGHKRINLKDTPCDILCAPGHKALFGIQGAGFVYFKENSSADSFIEGGSGTTSSSPDMPDYLPEKYEAGTLPSPSVISISEGIKFINEVGIDEIENKSLSLTQMAKERLLNIAGVIFYGADNGVLSFNYNDIPSYVISDELNKRGICTRGGLHCAPLAHRCIGTTSHGSVRLSFSFLNKKREVEYFYSAIKDICKQYT